MTPEPVIWKTGDKVMIEHMGRIVRGNVLLASANGESLMLSFDAMLGGHLGMMTVLRYEDGVFRSLFNNNPVTLAKGIDADG